MMQKYCAVRCVVGSAVWAFSGIFAACPQAISSTCVIQDGNQTTSDQKPDEEWDEASKTSHSYFRAFLTNAKAIRSGDCLLRITKTSDSVQGHEVPNPNGSLIEEMGWIRFRFDLDSGRFIHATLLGQNRLDLELSDPGTGQQTRRTTTKRLAAKSLCPSGRYYYENGSYNRFLFQNESEMKSFVPQFENTLPQLRAFGWLGRLDSTVAMVESDLSTQESNKFQSNISESEAHIAIRTNFGTKETPGYIETNLDKISLMPVKSAVFARLPDSFEKFPGEWARLSGQVNFVKWLELSDVWVASRVEHQTTESEDSLASPQQSQRFRVDTCFDLHWFSVNEKFEDEAFDGSLIDSERNVYRLLDPQLNNATTILERMKAEQPKVEPNPEMDAPKRD